MKSERSELGLDDQVTNGSKLEQSLLFLLLGVCFFMFSCLVFSPRWSIVWLKLPAQIAIEICWMFWLFGIVFIWWRPAVLRRLYISAERRMVRLGKVLVYVAVLLFLVSVGFVLTLTHLGILPVKPK